MNKTYFYIIQRDNQIHEIEYTQERFLSAIKEWQSGGLIVFLELGISVNGVDVKNVHGEEAYYNFIDTAKDLKTFIRNGSWYDIKDRNTPIRHQQWKQKYLDDLKKISDRKYTESKTADPEYVRKISQELKDKLII